MPFLLEMGIPFHEMIAMRGTFDIMKRSYLNKTSGGFAFA